MPEGNRLGRERVPWSEPLDSAESGPVVLGSNGPRALILVWCCDALGLGVIRALSVGFTFGPMWV
jgi:hypothetical protein